MPEKEYPAVLVMKNIPIISSFPPIISDYPQFTTVK
jgi:hypothetical protein